LKPYIARIICIAILTLPVLLWAGDKPAAETSVDSGSFAVYLSGKRVGTETFSITQSSTGSLTRSQFKMDDTGNLPSTSELRISPSGVLQSYDLKGDNGKSHSVIEPSEQILRQTMTYPGSSKTDERQYILPSSTVIMDDLAFVHQEVLLWRYIAGGCNGPNCELKPENFGVLIPAEQMSLSIKVEFVGREKIALHGKEVELSRFNMKSDASETNLWLDSNHKLVRILIPSTNTEVVRE
jgi:hypothetical protein